MRNNHYSIFLLLLIAALGLNSSLAKAEAFTHHVDLRGCNLQSAIPTNQPGNITGPTSLCAGATATYSIDAIPNAPGYNWSVPTNSGWVITNGASTNSITVTAGNQGGEISVEVTGCGNSSLAVTVNPNITPTFPTVGPYCSGATIAALPMTSSNGITGTWSPAINNTDTTTYTFMPSAGQCATTAQLTITINPNIPPTFAAVGPYCSGATIAALPMTSSNGITGTWSPAINNTDTTTYTFMPSAGQCATTAQLQISINPNITPTFTAVGTYCSGDTIAALQTTSNNGITGTWSPAINDTASTTYTFTPDAGQCATTALLPITINPNITPTFTAVEPYCSGATIAALPTISSNGITGTWSPEINNTATTTYTFTPTAGLCAPTVTLTITINPNITPTFPTVGPYCSGATIAALPMTSSNGITGTWSPAINNTDTTTYTFMPSAGQCATTAQLTITINPNIPPTFAAVGPYCSGATIVALPTTSSNGITGTWSPAINNTDTTTYTFMPSAGQCATTAQLTINVSSPPVPGIIDGIQTLCAGINNDTLYSIGSFGDLEWHVNTHTTGGPQVVLTNLTDSVEITLVATTPGCAADSVMAWVPVLENSMVSTIPADFSSCDNVPLTFAMNESYETYWSVNGVSQLDPTPNLAIADFLEYAGGVATVSMIAYDTTGCALSDTCYIELLTSPDQVTIESITPGLLGFEEIPNIEIAWGVTSAITQTEISFDANQNYYFYNNFDPLNNAYWVEVTNGLGCTTRSYFNTFVGLDEQTASPFQIFPNPAESFITIIPHSFGQESFSFRLYGADGRCIQDGSQNVGATSIQVGDLPPGLYHILLTQSDQIWSHPVMIR